MRKIVVALLLVVFGIGLAALVPTAQSAPCFGRGKGGLNGNGHCNRCPPPAPGCVFFECTACGCDYMCASVRVTRAPLPEAEKPAGPALAVRLSRSR